MGAAEIPLSPPFAVSPKETGFGTESGTAISPPDFSNEDHQPSSFFDKLIWIHYAGASFAGVTLLGLLIAVPTFPFVGNGGDSNKLLNHKSADTQIIAVHPPEEPQKTPNAPTPETSSGGLMTNGNPLSPSSSPLISNPNTAFNLPPNEGESAANPPPRRNERAANSAAGRCAAEIRRCRARKTPQTNADGSLKLLFNAALNTQD